MRKIDIEPVKELVKQMEYYLDGIRDAVRTGGDILENIDGQAEDAKKILLAFAALQLIEKPTKELDDREHSYLKAVEGILKKMDIAKSGWVDQVLDPSLKVDDLSHNETRQLIQAKAYAYIKRMLRERNNMPGPGASKNDIMWHVEGVLYDEDLFRKYEKHYYHSLQQVIDDITEEIWKHRTDNPQGELFA